MKLRAKLKDVVLLGDTDYETAEIIRLTEMVRKDPEARILIDLEYQYGNLVVTKFNTLGYIKNEEYKWTTMTNK